MRSGAQCHKSDTWAGAEREKSVRWQRAAHKNKTEIGEKCEENDRHDIGKKVEILAALFGEHLFHEDRHAMCVPYFQLAATPRKDI